MSNQDKDEESYTCAECRNVKYRLKPSKRKVCPACMKKYERSNQDSQDELTLEQAVMAYKRYPYGTKYAPHITGDKLLEVINAHTQKAQADILIWATGGIKEYTEDGHKAIHDRIATLTNQPNGRKE